jgi:hypothetical protein
MRATLTLPQLALRAGPFADPERFLLADQLTTEVRRVRPEHFTNICGLFEIGPWLNIINPPLQIMEICGFPTRLFDELLVPMRPAS